MTLESSMIVVKSWHDVHITKTSSCEGRIVIHFIRLAFRHNRLLQTLEKELLGIRDERE